MNDSQKKFNDQFESFKSKIHIESIVTGDYKSILLDDFGLIELKETTNEYDFDGTADLSSVYYFKDMDIYVRFYGYYRSYEGAGFNRYEFVNPIEKTITVYE